VNRYRIEPIQASHAVEGFDCGDEALNRFLIRFALANQRARASRTYVALVEDSVVGFHTLVVGEVSPEQAPERIRKGLARHPIPLMVLARRWRRLISPVSAPWRCMPRMNGRERSTSISAFEHRRVIPCTCLCS
jgi:hypothetical protein